MKILLCGDTHGRLPVLGYYQEACRKAVGADIAIQVGDFGFYKGIFKPKWAMPLKTYVIDGNHEDHLWLAKNSLLDADKWLEDRNIIYQPRGSVVSFGGSKIGFLGGAMNVDREQETSYCPDTANYVRDQDVEKAIKEFNKEQPELIVTHSCPHSIGVKMKGHPSFEPLIKTFVHKAGFTTGEIHDCGEEALKTVWEGLNYRPKAWVYGHFHVYKKSFVENVDFMCVGKTDDPNKNMMPIIWDTEKLELECFPNIKI